jgi:uncharacterized protein (TIGR03437 family)
MPSWEKCLARCAALMACALSAAAQSAVRPLEIGQTRYELRKGEPVRIAASDETLAFLLNARSRTITVADAPATGIVVGQDRSGAAVLAASLRAKPGEYDVTVTATSAAGETRQAVMRLAVAPSPAVPVGSTRPPVVLLNGWETGFTNTCPVSASSSDTFGNLASYLVSDGVPVVYLFDNCLEDPNATVETLGNDLGTFLNAIQYTDGTQVPAIDLVAFSMGGLIARSYLAGLQPDETLDPPAPTLVNKLILIATPNFGSFVAGNHESSLGAGTQSAELAPGSAFLWNLDTWNQHGDDLRGVPAIAIIGNAGAFIGSLTSGVSLSNASDGLVSTTSASLGLYTGSAIPSRIVPYCHVDPSVFTNVTIFGTYACNAAGIANVTDTSQLTGQIVRSYLGGTTAWQSVGSSPSSDAYLSAHGGMFFGLLNVSGAYASDVSAVTWGTVPLTGGADTDTIYYGDSLRGTGILSATSSSLGSVNCGSYAVLFGFFSALRCKKGATIGEVTPLLTTAPRVVTAGGNITITGADFSGLCLSGCTVAATPAGSTTRTNLQVTSSKWTNTAITAPLPASMTGLITLTVTALTGTDSIAIMAATASPPTIAAAPSSLQFTSDGVAVPAAQTIQITNSGSGTLAWTATTSQPWLTVSPTSGTAPSTVTVSVAPAGMSAGTYTGNVQITATGASNTPLTVAVTLTVTAVGPAGPVLSVSPSTLAFSYTVGGATPAAQTIAIANTGAGSLAWTATAADSWVSASPASGSAPGMLTVSVNPANMAAGNYTSSVQIAAAGATGSPASVAVSLTVQGTQPAPAITSVTNAASFQPGGASATWLAITGTNLSAVTYSWQSSDFVSGALPTTLQGVSVTINGMAAYISYISPTQINVLAPDDSATGSAAVQVTTAGQASNSVNLERSQFSPAFFTIGNGKYLAALHLDYTLVGSANLLAGVTSSPAKAGETILVYGTGFGPTNPALPTGQSIATPEPLASTAQVTIGGMTAAVSYAGLVSPGLYQFNVTVPNLPSGDAAVVATIGSVSTQTGISVTVQ